MDYETYRAMTEAERAELIAEHGARGLIEMIQAAPRAEDQVWRGVNLEFALLTPQARDSVIQKHGMDAIQRKLNLGRIDTEWRQ